MSKLIETPARVKASHDSRVLRCPRCKSPKLVTHAAAMNGQPISWFECSDCDWCWAASEGQLEFSFFVEQSTRQREGVR